jgi:hypothetical protein
MSQNKVCYDVAADCRVDLPRISTMDTKGGECSIDGSVIGDLGSKTYVSPYNVVYQRPGVTIREFNHAGLRLPQKRTFLGPEFFNSGCATLYGNSRFNGGPSSAMTDNSSVQAMFDFNFAPRPYFDGDGNNYPCFCAGSKGCGNLSSSFLGWEMDSTGTPIWKSKQQNAAQIKCGSQVPMQAQSIRN